MRGAAQAVVEVAARLGSAVANAAALRSCLRLPHARARPTRAFKTLVSSMRFTYMSLA